MAHPFDTDDWASPALELVAEGTYRIPLPMPNDGLRAVNVYLLLDGDEALLIDSGWADPVTKRHLLGAMTAISVKPRDVSRVLVTHAHQDHYTLGVELRRSFGWSVYLGAAEQPTMRDVVRGEGRSIAVQTPRLIRAGAWTLIRDVQRLVDEGAADAWVAGTWEMPDRWLADGEVIAIGRNRQVRAVHTPGHTAGHMIYVEDERGLLFSGDHVLPHITPSIGFEAVLNHRSLEDYLHSLELVAGMPPHRLLPAHGPVTDSAGQRAIELLAHHRTRLADILAACSPGHRTAFEIARALPWTSRRRSFGQLTTFNKVLAVVETLAHLDVLARRGSLQAAALPSGACEFTAAT